MKHMTEEELIAFREGVAEQRAVISEHLAACEECLGEFERIEAVLAALDTLPVPGPGPDYGPRGGRGGGAAAGGGNRRGGGVVGTKQREPRARRRGGGDLS